MDTIESGGWIGVGWRKGDMHENTQEKKIISIVYGRDVLRPVKVEVGWRAAVSIASYACVRGCLRAPFTR